MCSGMNVLQHGRHGYVAVCCGCGRFQVAFGTCLMQLEPDEVGRLAEELRQDHRAHRCHRCPMGKAFLYDVGAANMRVVLDHAEVVVLDGMLSDALWLHGIYARVTEPMDG